MLISLIKLTHIENHTLPSKVYGNYWIQDKNAKGEVRNLINIEEYNGKWKVDSNDDVKILVNGTFQKAAILQDYCFCILKVKGENDILLYCCPKYDPSYLKYQIGSNLSATIGYLDDNSIVIKNRNISDRQISLTYTNGVWQFKNLDIRVPIYINNKVKSGGILSYGDVIFVLGLKIIVMKDFLAINNPFNCVSVNNSFIPFKNQAIEHIQPMPEDTSITVYEKDEYFYKSPRFRTFIEHEKIKIDAPPMKQEFEEQPLILTLGPMLTMSLSSLMSAAVVINNVTSGNSTWSSAIPTLVVSITMVITMILWPTLTRIYRKKRREKKEKKRQTKYKEYIEKKRKNIKDVIVRQKQILIENTISLQECKSVIENRKRNLWERKLEHDDFLNVRIGIGNLEPDLDIAYPEEHFTVDEDDLRDSLNDLVSESKMIEEVPIGISLTNKKISAIVGDDLLTKQFIDGLILQIITFHSYDDVKIVLLTDEDRSEKWNYIKLLPHCWSDNKQVRFFGTTPEEVKQVTNYLDEELNSRISSEISKGNIEYKNYSPYYVILIDNLKIVRSNYFIKKLLSRKDNFGFSILIKNDKLSNLPNECTTFINIDKQTSGIFENELVTNKQKEFKETLLEDIDMESLAIKLANIPIETNKTVSMLPKSLGFLEMFNVGKIEQLNILNRWKKNNPVLSLETPVGIDGAEELVKLDLHEKFHGPHGLIAGMTGSGKSEFIITYILSMAVNYSPDEVNFILIDYKGGGLAGAFENRETGLKLPHLVGTITNLDTASMRRSLASIQSELKRRQKEFNKAREQLNESTMDIYKYQKYYRDGNLNKPISHLFIISDEFAELKAQKPEFMEQLISTARIGRSLGVHLILATQKPNGVVNDQIWSNTRFRVCLKVQDKSDSTDMIKTPEAAYLKEAGRFYLQVGYNEYFVLGQSAFSGTQYRMSDKLEKKVDLSLNFIDNTGNVYKSTEEKIINDNVKIMGEELPNVVGFLDNLAKSQNIKTSPLWLNPIPAYINVVELIKKYNYMKKEFVLNPVIGEFDIPHNQEQRILTLPLSVDGNSIIYGAAGSGKELMLSTIMYSLIMNHTALEVNLYAIDCGAETLKMFSKAPQVGDILVSTDEEKIDNLFKFLKDEIDVRKDLFSNYNGDYNSYIKGSNSKLPNIVVIINNYESFSELYGGYEDILLQLTRDCLKYGIIFILTASAANGIRYKLKQNFKQLVTLQLNDEGEYSSVVGNTKKLYPSDIYGRGLVRLDSEVYEFQTASAAPNEEIPKFISNFCNELLNASSIKAQKIKVLPNFVSYDYVKDSIKSLSKVPIGISKDNLKIVTHNFNKYTTLITGLDNDSFRFFIPVLAKVLSNINGIYFSLINTLDDLEVSSEVKVYNNSFSDIFNEIKEKITKIDKDYKNSGFNKDILNALPTSVYMIYGFEKFKSRLPLEEQKELTVLIEKGKELEKFKFIFVDSIDKFKKYEYETWYKNVINSNQGIWIGNGIDNQFIIKLNRIPKSAREELPLDFGFYVSSGNANKVKFLNETAIKKD